MAWLVGLLLMIFLHSDFEHNHLLPFCPHILCPSLHGQLVILLNSPVERLFAIVFQVLYSRTEIMVVPPPTPFSKRNVCLHHFCESGTFWHVVHGPAYQKTTHRT